MFFNQRRINYLINRLSIEKFQVFLKSSREITPKLNKKMIFFITARSFNLPIKDSSKISCFKASFIEVTNANNIVILIKSYIKMGLIIAIYFLLWFYIAIFVESIYKQYGKNVIKICIMPLVSMLFIKLCIIMNIEFLLAALILYTKGKSYINTAKISLLYRLIFSIFVNPMAINHYCAILYYTLLN